MRLNLVAAAAMALLSKITLTTTRAQRNQIGKSQMRIAIYVRVSTQRQKTEGDSLEAQRNNANRYVEQLRHRLADSDKQPVQITTAFYEDAGRSAKDQNRPELARLKSDIKASRVDRIVCWKLDRITRSIVDFLELSELFRQHGVEFVSLQEQFDTSTPMGKAMLLIIMVFAQLERELTGERTKATMEDRAERGLWNGGRILGYAKDPQEKGRLIVDAEWAKIIREQFFEAAIRLGSIGKVRDRLRELGIRIPTRTSRSGKLYGGRYFSKQQVGQILRNKLYLGEVQWGSVRTPNAHPPIIDASLFEEVRRILASNRQTRRNLKQPTAHVYLLKGLIRCGQCGAMMTPKSCSGRNGVHFYYTCTRQTHHGRKACCTPYLPVTVEDVIVQRLVELSGDEPEREKIVDAALGQIGNHKLVLEAEIEIVRRQAAVTQAQINNLVEVLKASGAAGLASVADELRRLQAELNQQHAKMRELQLSQSMVVETSDEGRRFLESWRTVGQALQLASPSEKQELLPHLIEVVEFHPAQNSKTGTYRLRLLPDAAGSGTTTDQCNSATNAGSLTAVRSEDVPAPEVGLEPTTQRLTAACSTN